MNVARSLPSDKLRWARLTREEAPTDAACQALMCDENWVHIAEHRDFWRECVVKAAKFHYNYRDPDEQVAKRSFVRVKPFT